ncbi:folylpolyglutamate synthase/dihydrofolate synthase family protein [soil metagenome]
MSSADEAEPRYRAALQGLSERGRFGIRLGLGRTRALLRRLGNPERQLRGVLVGGTNGKGSVQALVAAALRQAGVRVGQTPKPHLLSYRERVVVDGRPIEALDFAQLIERVLSEAEAVERRHGPPTEFEVLTAAAFSWFAASAVEVGVVEVGMGGRLDATNTWQGGLTAITNVALDHTEHLGPTIAAIAREKAQIIKRGDSLALTAAVGEARTILGRRAGRLGVPLRDAQALKVLRMDRAGLCLETPRGELRLGLLGRHQADNAGLALAVLEGLAEAGLADVPDEALRLAWQDARWPGRLELLALGSDGRAHPAETGAPHPAAPDVLLDGAHNPHGTAALAVALDELRPLLSTGRLTLLLGVLRDRDVPALLDPLLHLPFMAHAQLIATDVPGTPRALPAADLASSWRSGSLRAGRAHPATRTLANVDEALTEAVETCRREAGPLLVCGSLYLVGHVRGRLVG